MIKRYLGHYYKKFSKKDEEKKDYISRELPKIKEELHRCLLLNNYFWGIWSLRMLKEEKLGDPNVFNFDFAQARIDMFNHVKALYFKE